MFYRLLMCQSRDFFGLERVTSAINNFKRLKQITTNEKYYVFRYFCGRDDENCSGLKCGRFMLIWE
jgi:hypothetical protein